VHYDRFGLHTVKEHPDLPHITLPEHYPTYAQINISKSRDKIKIAAKFA
jgi:hypothetical protein